MGSNHRISPSQTKLLFNTLQKLQIPTIIFINKIDRAGVNLERLYLDIKTNLSQDALIMQTVVDGLVYPICSQTYIQEEYKEFVCNHDDNILERYRAQKEELEKEAMLRNPETAYLVSDEEFDRQLDELGWSTVDTACLL